MNTSSTALDKHLGQLHNGSDTTVTSVSVGNDGTQIVDLGSLCTFLGGHGQTSLALLAVVEELSKEKMLNLVRNGVHRVVSKIRTGLVAGGGSGRALPTADVAVKK